MGKEAHLIFVSYASPDRHRVLPIADWLEQQGFDIWMDAKRLIPGQNWDFEINRALDKSCIILIFISSNSIDRRGYIQKELRVALDKAKEKLIDDIYIIPIILDIDLDIPEQVRHIQCIRISENDYKNVIYKSIIYQLDRLGVKIEESQREAGISWSTTEYAESWEGLPGYDVEIQSICFTSDVYSRINEINNYINGNIYGNIFKYRKLKLEQNHDVYNHCQDRCLRTDTYDAHCRDPIIKGKILSVQYTVHWYGAGAAHPNMYFLTYSFLLDPLTLLSSPEEIFINSSDALEIIQRQVRSVLMSSLSMDDCDGDSLSDDDVGWIYNGTSGWECFSAFVFAENGIEFLFSTYSVACYASGPQFANVPYEQIVHHLKPAYCYALGVDHLKWQKR